MNEDLKQQAGGAMPLNEALQVLAAVRREEMVITTMGAAREWPKLSEHALDFHYLPSAMGQAPLLGLGLALAKPEREVIVLNGDGCMLMNLGCLVTIAASQAANFTLVVLENGLYEVTGGQATAAAAAGPRVDFAALARAASIASAQVYDNLEMWRNEAQAVLTAPGPRFICLRVAPVGADYQLRPLASMADQITSFRQAIDFMEDGLPRPSP
jgi:thiamine pyrophosphate-dependent acetolactate synthase large subunit-like protein